jgi:hypothetical protein
MKKIVKFYKKIDPVNETWIALIMMPIERIAPSSRSANMIQEILKNALSSSNKKVKKIEKKLLEAMIPEISRGAEIQGLVVERNFNICVKNEIIQISDYTLVSDNETSVIDLYFKEYTEKINT